MKDVELSLEKYMKTLNLPVVLSGFHWKHRGRILDSRSAIRFYEAPIGTKRVSEIPGLGAQGLL